MQKDLPMQATAELTEREREILRLLATGAGNKEIARHLFISANTVKVHLRNIFAKIGVTSRTEAAVYAIREGLTQSPDLPAAAPATQELPTAIPTPLEIKSKPHSLWIAALVTVLLVGLVTLVVTIYRSPTIAVASPAPAASQRWQELAALPTARGGLAVAVYENQIYVIAGEAANGVTGALERYDPTSNTWDTLTPKPVPVADVSTAVIGGKVYVPGGRTASGTVTDILEAYDPRNDRWERRASLPEALSAYALVALEGKLYLFGGWTGERYVASVYEYNPDQDKWQARAPMLTARGYAGATVAGGKVYVIGGTDGEQTLAVNEEYVPERDTSTENPWQTRTPMPAGRAGMGVTTIADIIHVIGGQGEDDQTLTPLKYFPQTDQWQTFEDPLPQVWSQLGLTSLETYLYALGGRLDGVLTQCHMAYQAIYTIVVPMVK